MVRIVLKVNVMIITFMDLYNSLYFLKTNKHKEIIIIITVYAFMLKKSPKRVEVKPAVTMVTAVLMINIVARLSMKYIVSISFPSFLQPSNRLSLTYLELY